LNMVMLNIGINLYLINNSTSKNLVSPPKPLIKTSDKFWGN